MIDKLLSIIWLRTTPMPDRYDEYDDILSDEYLADVLKLECEPERQRLEREVREMSEGITAHITRLREISGSAGLRAA